MVEAMEIQKGFKQSEVGIIPSDWEMKKLGEISDIDTETLSSSTNPDYCFQYISIDDVDNGVLRNKTEMFFKNAPSRAKRKIRLNDILISTVRPNLKSHLFIQEEVKGWICSTGFSVIRCKTDIANSGFVYNYFFSSIINKQIDNLISGSNYPAINSKDVCSLLIPLPPTKAEQTAIAEALNNADALIAQLEKLIVKKRNIKQGAMQELLKPKEGWEVKNLGDLTDSIRTIRYGIVQPGQFSNDGILMLRSQDYSKGWADPSTMHRVTERLALQYKNARLQHGDIIMTVVGANTGQVVEAPYWLHGAILSRSTARIAFSGENKSYIGFIKFYLQSHSGKIQVLNHLKEGAQPVLSCADLFKFKIPLPPTKAEQTAIAQIISDMDTEIEALEKKLEKYKMVKQGMMQNLLTGKIRLP